MTTFTRAEFDGSSKATPVGDDLESSCEHPPRGINQYASFTFFLAGEVSAAANNVRSLVVQRKVRVILFVAGCCC